MEMTPSVTNAALLRLVSRSALRVSLSSLLLGMSGCGYYASRTAHEAQVTMIGMTEEDVQACAGIPTRTQTISSRVKILEYQRGRNIGAPTTSTLIPVQSVVNVVRDIGGGDGNICIADFRIVDGKVSDVYYSGDNDMLVGTDGVCSSVVRGCVRRAVSSGSPSDFWRTSAFLQPQPEGPPPASALPPAGSDTAPMAPPLAAPEDMSGAAPTSATHPALTPSATVPAATPTSASPVTPAVTPTGTPIGTSTGTFTGTSPVTPTGTPNSTPKAPAPATPIATPMSSAAPTTLPNAALTPSSTVAPAVTPAQGAPAAAASAPALKVLQVKSTTSGAQPSPASTGPSPASSTSAEALPSAVDPAPELPSSANTAPATQAPQQ